MSGTWPGFSSDWEESSEYQERKAQLRRERGRTMTFDWQESGPEEDTASRLSARGIPAMQGVSMIVEAYAVHFDDATRQQTPDHQWGEEALSGIESIDAGDGPRETFERNGREYVLVAYPHCQ